jgi:acyl-CoA synthetase (AMP-forming)/AMP-acid ligase II
VNLNKLPDRRTPRGRAVRTVLQVIVAVLGAVPAAVAVLPASWTDSRASLVAIAGAAVILVSAAQNALDERAGRG